MALTKGDYLRPARTLISGSIPTLTIAETTGETFAVGELLQITTGAGAMKLCATTSNILATSGTSGLIFGVSCTTGKALTSAVTSASTGATQFIPAVGWMVWEIAVHNATTASAKIKSTQLGNCYTINRSTTNKIWYLNLASQSPIHAYVIGFRDATGTHQGHVYVTFSTSARHMAWRV